jgi:hypothetical protein
MMRAAGVVADRELIYGSPVECFERIAALATITLNKEVSTYDVAMILHCTHLGRLQQDRTNVEHYVDGINYLAFASEFIDSQRSVMVAMDDDIAAMARKLSPKKENADG